MERIEISSLIKWELCEFDDGQHEWFTIGGKILGNKRFEKLVANNGPLMYGGYAIDNTQDLWWVYNVVLADEIISEMLAKCPKGQAKPIPEAIRKQMNKAK